MSKVPTELARSRHALAMASQDVVRAKANAARTVLHQPAPPCTTPHRASRSDKTNPNDDRELSPRQLAVARALVRGGPITAVARQTQTSRHTINRWRRLPKFQQEIRRLHELLAMQSNPQPVPCLPSSKPAVASAARPSRPVPDTRGIDRQFDKRLDELLGQGIPKGR
jgi:transposase-like protein